ncbi:MAG: hypothetical protein LLH30_12930 [Candidatus Manganitrophus sp. SA1]|nr:hypothetical protein [Candidatus Manganitrophus morganii]
MFTIGSGLRVELHFLDSGFMGTAVRKEKEIEKMQEKVRVVAEGIRKEDFEARPTYIACQYCATRIFVRIRRERSRNVRDPKLFPFFIFQAG